MLNFIILILHSVSKLIWGCCSATAFQYIQYSDHVVLLHHKKYRAFIEDNMSVAFDKDKIEYCLRMDIVIQSPP